MTFTGKSGDTTTISLYEKNDCFIHLCRDTAAGPGPNQHRKDELEKRD